ncbi:MAG: hypothetical protein VYA35_04230 [Pseudomonadota bacterium]|nr:hypothetical protein [Sphingobium naphthae]MEE2740572.1 hypothetical protein [Pseudomonadota bacterium]
MPYLLPNRLPGLVVYEVGPGLLLAVALWFAVSITRGCFRTRTRLILFVVMAALVGSIAIGNAFAPSLDGRWL